MKATEQNVFVVLFSMLYKVILTFESVNEILISVAIQMKVTEQWFPEVVFIINMLPKVVLTFDSTDEIPKSWCSNKNNQEVLLIGAFT